jgi:hypothetical protein
MVARKRKVDDAKAAEREKARMAAAAQRAQKGGVYDPFAAQHAVRRSVPDEAVSKLRGLNENVYTRIYVGDAFGEAEGGGKRVERVVGDMRGLLEGSGWAVEGKGGAEGLLAKALHRAEGQEEAVEMSVRLVRDKDMSLVFECKRVGGSIFDYKKAFDKVSLAVAGGAGGTGAGAAGEEQLGSGSEPVDMI